jgi:hypothetical protein
MLCFLVNALTILSSVIASIIYCSGHIGAVIASYSYRYKLINQRYCFYSLSLLTSSIPLSEELERDLIFFLTEFALNIRSSQHLWVDIFSITIIVYSA